MKFCVRTKLSKETSRAKNGLNFPTLTGSYREPNIIYTIK